MTPMDLRNIHTTRNVTTPQQSATKKHLFLYLQGDTSDLRKPKKRISINTNHSYHQQSSKPVSTDLKIKPDSVLSNPKEKDWVQRWTI